MSTSAYSLTYFPYRSKEKKWQATDRKKNSYKKINNFKILNTRADSKFEALLYLVVRKILSIIKIYLCRYTLTC